MTGWREQAECKGMGPDLFYPTTTESAVAAKRVCAVCPVRTECATENMGEMFGVFGGLSERERFRRRNRIPLDVSMGSTHNGPLPYTGPQQNHGTQQGYRDHLKRSEFPCAACREHQQQRRAGYRARTRGA